MRSRPLRPVAFQHLLTAARALRHSLALGDALYVALARRLGALLVTADARLAQAPSRGIAVELVASRS